MRQTPEIMEVDNAHLEEVLRRVEQALDEKDATLIRRLFESYAYVADLVEDKNTTIRRLRQLFFGKRTEKTKAVVEKPAATPQRDGTTDAESAPDPPQAGASAQAAETHVGSGHGRNG